MRGGNPCPIIFILNLDNSAAGTVSSTDFPAGITKATTPLIVFELRDHRTAEPGLNMSDSVQEIASANERGATGEFQNAKIAESFLEATGRR